MATGTGFGKVILLGEHAVVYGSHALAVPIDLKVVAHVSARPGKGVQLQVPAWDLDHTWHGEGSGGPLFASLRVVWGALGCAPEGLRLHLAPELPPRAGLGCSAAVAVATIRALAAHLQRSFDDAHINVIAHAAEATVHGRASGIDNTLATYGATMLFARGLAMPRRLQAGATLHLVLGLTGVASATATMVAQLAARRAAHPAQTEAAFARIDALARRGATALQAGDVAALGAAMDANHAELADLDLSSAALDELVGICRAHGALGAKLTGSGGGGAMVALAADAAGAARLHQAMGAAGFAGHVLRVAGDAPGAPAAPI